MRWRVLGLVLAAILLGAVVFATWPSTVVVPAEPMVVAAPRAVDAPAPSQVAPEIRPAPKAAPAVTRETPSAPEVAAFGVSDEEPDPEHLRALGLGPEDVEPRDGGPLHPLTRQGIKSAVTAELPQIRECYEGWLLQNPSLSGKMKVQFTIVEIPGRDRGKIMRVEIADGGMGRLAMEGCVRNVFKSMRFERPENGEMRVSYPLSFESK